MSDHQNSTKPIIRLLVATILGATLLGLAGLTLTGAVITLIIATPVLVLFSPILLPAGMVIFFATAGFVLSSGCGVVALMALSWVYDYVAGKHPPGADKVDYARSRIGIKAREMRERAMEYGHYGQQNRCPEATQAA